MDFEKLMSRLNEITTKLEDKTTTLEESFLLYDEGLKISQQCNMLLDEYSHRLNNTKSDCAETENKVDDNE